MASEEIQTSSAVVTVHFTFITHIVIVLATFPLTSLGPAGTGRDGEEREKAKCKRRGRRS